MIISINAEKASDKIQHPFIIIIKNLSRKFAGGIFLPQHNKGHTQQTHSKHYSQQWKIVPLR